MCFILGLPVSHVLCVFACVKKVVPRYLKATFARVASSRGSLHHTADELKFQFQWWISGADLGYLIGGLLPG